MCLNTITKRVEKPSKKVTKAWKIFNIDPATGQLKNYYLPHKPSPKQGFWMKAIEEEIYSNDSNEKYFSGFHCYTNKKQALAFHGNPLGRNIVLIEVKIKEITTYGTQWSWPLCESIVARQMLVPRQPKTTQTKK